MADLQTSLAELPRLFLISAFLAMEPPDRLICLAKECTGGSLTEEIQRFIWEYCVRNSGEQCQSLYLKILLKKIIREVESDSGVVLDDFYQQYAYYMATIKDGALNKENSWIVKSVSFLFNNETLGYSNLKKLVVPLQCSVNMLEGDTGCALWPSCLYLSEFILSFPGVFRNRSCFEVGSGAGLVGICLSHVKASKVIMSDGDLSTLANLKLNLEMNQLSEGQSTEEDTTMSNELHDKWKKIHIINLEVILHAVIVYEVNIHAGKIPRVECIHLPWDSAKDIELQALNPDFILGADVIYNPSCLPHLVRVLSVMLKQRKPLAHHIQQRKPPLGGYIKEVDASNTVLSKDTHPEEVISSLTRELELGPVALIATVIRNIDTFNCFVSLASEASLTIRDLTETIRPAKLLPYMKSYPRSDVRLLILSSCQT